MMVKHKTVVKVGEKGTEVAAVTALGGWGSGYPPPLPTMTVDRPYIVAIHDRDTGAQLFIGKIADPPPLSEE